ncbi:MAG: sugar transferase, partial [Eubacterium sp.]
MRNRYVSKGIKRTFDLFSVLFLGIIFAPIWCLIALIIKFDSKGPIFFTQERPGFHRQLFKIYKFRTMQIG